MKGAVQLVIVKGLLQASINGMSQCIKWNRVGQKAEQNHTYTVTILQGNCLTICLEQFCVTGVQYNMFGVVYLQVISN